MNLTKYGGFPLNFPWMTDFQMISVGFFAASWKTNLFFLILFSEKRAVSFWTKFPPNLLAEVDQLITGFSRESLQFEQPPLMHLGRKGEMI